MSALGLFLWIAFGIALQVGLFLGIGFWRHWQSYTLLKAGLGGTVEAPPVVAPSEASGWTGFRSFRVAERVVEDAAGQICSFHLVAEDGQALPAYAPGQFLTFRVDLPKADGRGTEQVTRCYSLSDAPRPDHYRISVKRVAAPSGTAHPPGRCSNFLHDHVPVGTMLQVRAPSGHFHLGAGSGPVVLIAGGIGITPMIAMLNWCQAHQPDREVWLYYGVRNSREVAFAGHLRATAAANPQVRLRLCFSDPLPSDRPGTDFHHRGRVDVQLFRSELPLRPYHYYLCGPSAMMEHLVSALEDWGVPDSNIHFEAFGPASVKRRLPDAGGAPAGTTEAAQEFLVTFAKSGKQAKWSAASGSLLEFAEAQGVAVDSGCRAGGCGTCQTTLQSGAVHYRQSPDYDPEPGTCLMCVCTPASHLTLEA